MNDDDDDTYGFGSFSDLFDVGASQIKQRLNVDALGRFCMSDRLLTRFQQHQVQDKRCVMFQHVAAKFDGVSIDGGLGMVSVTSLDGGGIVWLQTTQLDSDALEKRRKEMQDVTNASNKSAATLFLAIAQVADVLPTTVQNTVQGVEIKLVDGNRLELIFMPGPFAGATHRDEFLDELKKQMSDTVSGEVEVKTTPERRKEELRRLVRRYTKLDEKSGEGLAIAKQVYADTGYHLGPMTKETPKFLADSEYRKKSVEKLTGFLNRMNQEWSDADLQRELHTKAKHSRNEDGLFEYTDIVTGVHIPSRAYEQRYLQYVKAHEVNPVLHLFPGQEKAAQGDKLTKNGSSSAISELDENAKSLLMVTLGIGISPSCIIDKDFFSSGATHAPLDIHQYRGEDMAFRAAVDRDRANLWHSWGTAFDRVSGNYAIQVGRGHFENQSQPTIGVAATRKRARERRRSLVLPNSDDFQSTIEASVASSPEDANDTAPSRGDSHQSRPKRSRSMSHKSDTARKSRRKVRRQSIVSQVDLASIVTNEAEEKTTMKDCRAFQSSRKSPQPRHPVNGYARDTSSLEMVEDEDSDLCQLCYSEQALVHMNPCDHAICSSCWSRLSPSSGKIGPSSRRVCPWDREVVTKRK